MPVNPKSASTSLRRTACALALGLAFGTSLPLAAQVTPAFTWQGELRSGGNPANASFDMEFRLYNAASGGSPIGPLVTRPNVPAVNGLFNVQLDFGPAQFAGDRQWLEVRIKPAGSGSYETLAPRTEMTATPYALGAVAALPNSVTTTSLVDATVQGVDIAPGAVGAAQVNPAQVQRRVSGSCAGSQGVQAIAVDGTVSCGSFAGGVGTVTSVATGAGLTGGPITASGTISVAPGGIGTTEINSAQVQRRVSGTCAGSNFVQQVNQDGSVGCAPAGTASGWSLSGNAGTNAGTDFIGTTDAQPFVVRTQNVPSLRIEPNVGNGSEVITSNLIGGSSANSLTPGVRGATLSGGGVPAADSDPDLPSGSPNRITDHYGTVGGGFGNRAGDDAEPLFGAPFATVGGGRGNVSAGNASTVAGGWSNTAGDSLSSVGGGFFNNASGNSSAVGGGQFNHAGGGSSTISGGRSNAASAADSSVGGGAMNSATQIAATTAGGSGNTASGQGGTVGGGQNNTASGAFSTVAGGQDNCAGAPWSWAGGRGARVNPEAGARCGTITGVFGEGDRGTFLWADSLASELVSVAPNMFHVRAGGGVYFNAIAGGSGVVDVHLGTRAAAGGGNDDFDLVLGSRIRSLLIEFNNQFGWLRTRGATSYALGQSGTEGDHFLTTSTGAHLTFGGTWTNASSRTLKTGFAPVDVTDTLSRVLALPLTRWVYRASPQEGEHLGPVAEDFHAAFGLGADAKSISTTDASGVALAAIQGLNAKLEAENAALRAELAELREMVEASMPRRP